MPKACHSHELQRPRRGRPADAGSHDRRPVAPQANKPRAEGRPFSTRALSCTRSPAAADRTPSSPGGGWPIGTMPGNSASGGSQGIEIFVTARIRPSAGHRGRSRLAQWDSLTSTGGPCRDSRPEEHLPGGPRDLAASRRSFRFGLQFSDGRSTSGSLRSTWRWWHDDREWWVRILSGETLAAAGRRSVGPPGGAARPAARAGLLHRLRAARRAR
jgi:hypothetical protein